MIKLQLLGIDITFEVIYGLKTQKIEICNGVYNGKKFNNAILIDNSIILEGNESVAICSSYIACNIKIKSIVDKINEVIQDDSIYIVGAKAIPEGEERGIIEKLIDNS